MIDEYFFDETFTGEIDLEEFPIDSNSSSIGIARVCINNIRNFIRKEKSI